MIGLPSIYLICSLLTQNVPQASKMKFDRNPYYLASVQASQLRLQSEFEKAASVLENVLSNSNHGLSLFTQRMILVRLAILKWNIGDIEGSARCFDQARTDFKITEDKRSESFCSKCLKIIWLYNQGKDNRKAKLYYRSLERFEKAIDLGRETGFLDFELKCLRQQGQTYLEMLSPEAFWDCNRRGLDISIKINHGIEKGRCLNNIGVYHQRHNNFSVAVAYFENALIEAKKNMDQQTEAECLSNLGMGYRELGNLSRSLSYLTEALALDKKNENLNAIIMDLGNLGGVYLRGAMDNHDRDDLQNGLEAFKECLSLLEERKADLRIKISVLNNIGIIYNELGDFTNARLSLDLAMKIVERETYVQEKCFILNNIAMSFLYENNVGQAKHYFRLSYDLGFLQSLECAMMESSLGLGRCYELSQQESEALQFYRNSIDAMERIRTRISSEPFLIGFARNKLSAYQGAIRILSRQYSVRPSGKLLEEIFSLIERAKARAFLESIREVRMDSANGGSSEQMERQSGISKNISELTWKLFDGRMSKKEKVALNNELEWEEEEYYRLTTEMKTNKRLIQNDAQGETCSIAKIQENILSSRTVLFEYFLGEEESYLILISARRAELFVLDGRIEIERSLRAYLKVLADESFAQGAIDRAGERIGKELIPSEAWDEIVKAEALIILPDGILHYLPFETLRRHGSKSSWYLIETTIISYCPSVSVLCALKEKKTRRVWEKDLLAIGGPEYEQTNKGAYESWAMRKEALRKSYLSQDLNFKSLPYSKKEVVDISKLFPKDRTQVLVGVTANEEIIKSTALKEFRFIHFACHGILDEKHPLRSALVLSGGERQDEDGFLQMREIYGLTINADIVVLSACQTGRGTLEKAEGPMALARSFFFAGARSVIASLWPINDKTTRKIMVEFYDNIVRGASIGESLRKAKIMMIRSSWRHPFFWAGFILQGDSSLVSVY